MKKSSIHVLIVATVCLLLSFTTGAQDKKLYSWTDENGTVHFSDIQPEGQVVEERNIPQDAPPASDNPYQDVDAGPSAAEQRRQDIAQKSEQAQIQQAMNSAQCPSWQAEVDRLEPNRRVFSTNEQGETVRMDDVERINRVAELKAQIAKNCK
jgi:hypothetical protein